MDVYGWGIVHLPWVLARFIAPLAVPLFPVNISMCIIIVRTKYIGTELGAGSRSIKYYGISLYISLELYSLLDYKIIQMQNIKTILGC